MQSTASSRDWSTAELSERRSTGRRAYRDLSYLDDDLERDLDLAVEQTVTLRLGGGQVFARSCATAIRVGAVLQARGRQGSPTICGADCAVADPSAA